MLTSDELTGSLRQLKPCFVVARDRFKSLQKRGAIEVRRRSRAALPARCDHTFSDRMGLFRACLCYGCTAVDSQALRVNDVRLLTCMLVNKVVDSQVLRVNDPIMLSFILLVALQVRKYRQPKGPGKKVVFEKGARREKAEEAQEQLVALRKARVAAQNGKKAGR